MNLKDRYIDRIRGFDLLEQLPPSLLESLIARSGSFIQCAPGDLVYAQGQEDSFSEESAITGAPRSATVRMSTNGSLMRLSKADFVELIANSLIRGVTGREAAYLQNTGFALIDVRDSAEFCRGTLEGAINVPVHLIRTHMRDPSKDENYIICHTDPEQARLGVLFFLEMRFGRQLS